MENTHSLLVGLQTYIATVEISVGIAQKDENQSTSRSSYTTLDHIPKGCAILPQRHVLNCAALFITARNYKQDQQKSG